MLKKIILAAVVAVMVIPVAARADEYTTIKDMMLDLADYVVLLEDSLNQEIVHLQVDIIGEVGVRYSRTLYEGYTYGITAFGGWRVSDLDIIVYKDVDGQWVEIERDEDVDNQPTVFVEPSSSGTYAIDLEVYTWEEGYTAAHYGLIIFHELE